MNKSFDKDNELSVKWSNDADAVYCKLYHCNPTDIEFMDFDTPKGKEAQLNGIDKVITCPDGHTVTVDEKTHRISDNLCIEFWSDVNTGKKGWLYTSKADYISQIEPRQDKMLLVSMATIREYARTHLEDFKKKGMIWQTSERNGRSWKSGHVNVREKDLIEWAKKTTGVEKPWVLPLHEYK